MLTFVWILDSFRGDGTRYTLMAGNETGGTIYDVTASAPAKGRSWTTPWMFPGVVHIWWESNYYADPTGLFDLLATWTDADGRLWSQDGAGVVTDITPDPTDLASLVISMSDIRPRA
jgi:hypothetical protein